MASVSTGCVWHQDLVSAQSYPIFISLELATQTCGTNNTVTKIHTKVKKQGIVSQVWALHVPSWGWKHTCKASTVNTHHSYTSVEEKKGTLCLFGSPSSSWNKSLRCAESGVVITQTVWQSSYKDWILKLILIPHYHDYYYHHHHRTRSSGRREDKMKKWRREFRFSPGVSLLFQDQEVTRGRASFSLPCLRTAQPLLMVLYEGCDPGSRGLLAALSVR